MHMKKLLFMVLILSLQVRQVFAAPFPPIFPISFQTIIENLLSVLPAVIILTFMGLFFWGGYTWMTASDDEDKVKKARSILFSALIGLLLILVAGPILSFLEAFFGIDQPIIN